MARTSNHIAVPPAQVWAVLADARTYEHWVVGCKEIRAVDDGWPAPGSSFHHAVGIGPLTIKDSTTVEASQPDRRLVLRARARPTGIARVEIDLREDGGGTHVEMHEVPVEGLPAKLHNALQDRLIHQRNVKTLDRLKRLAEARR